MPATQLASLNRHGRRTTRLDVLPHTCSQPISLPSLQVLRLFPAAQGKLCGHGMCPALRALRPATLVVVSTADLNQVVGDIPALVPYPALSRVKKLVLVLPSAHGSLPKTRWAQSVDVVVVDAARRTLRPRPLPPWGRSLGWSNPSKGLPVPPPGGITFVGTEGVQSAYRVQYRGKGRTWRELHDYLQGEEVFSAAETVACRPVPRRMPRYW